MRTLKKTAVLVAEHNSDWQDWADQLRSVAPALRVVAQREGESASRFAARVRNALTHAEAEVTEAVLVGGSACDPEVLAARVLMVRAVTSRMSARGTLRLDGQGRGRLAMEALAQICADQLSASGVAVDAGGIAPAAPPAAPAALPMPLAA